MGDKDKNIKRSGKKKTAFLAAFLACSLCLLCFALYYWNPSVRQYLITGGRIHMISIDGIFNVRDIGGWKTTDGKSIRYGLIYRGSEMDGIHHVNISARGIEQMKDLGILTEVDLRNSEETETAVYPLKSFADYSRYEIEAYMGVSRNKELYKEALSAVIDGVLNDRPVYVHCWGGADRTGTTAFLLGALLGMSDDDLILDYELTSCAIYGARKRNFKLFNDMLNVLDRYPGNSFAEKGTAYLHDIGLTDKTLDRLREIFLQS